MPPTRFADTSFWIALILRRDHHHEAAASLWSQRDGRILVTNHVLGEVWSFLRRRDGFEMARRARRLISLSDAVDLAHVSPDLEAEAWLWLERHDERPYSFVDSTSFALMRREGLLEALAFDDDFHAAGFVQVTP